jgi:hypothetical protein
VAAGGTSLFVLSPHWWWRGDDPWDLWRLVSGHGYLIVPVLVVGWPRPVSFGRSVWPGSDIQVRFDLF